MSRVRGALRGHRDNPLRLSLHTADSRHSCMQPTPTSSSPSNRGSRRRPHPETPPSLDFPPAPFPQQLDYSTDQYNFPTPTFQRPRAISSYAQDSGSSLRFPEPQLYRAGTTKATYRPLTPTTDLRNHRRTSPRPSPPALPPALPPAIPPRNFVASPITDDKKVIFRSFNR